MRLFPWHNMADWSVSSRGDTAFRHLWLSLRCPPLVTFKTSRLDPCVYANRTPVVTLCALTLNSYWRPASRRLKCTCV
jgi:hypothetical protein